MILCDTNILIHAFNGKTNTIQELNNIGYSNIVLSAVTVMELLQGMGNKTELAQMKKKLKYFDVIQFDDLISEKAIELIENFRLSHNLQIPDAIIGATATVHQIPFFTYNIKDFRFMPNIVFHQVV
jgi:predicted nucleic acid-binding protein